MDKLLCLAVLAIMTLKGLVQGEVELYWTSTEKMMYEPGKVDLDLSCFLNQKFSYLMQHNVDIYFRQPWKNSGDVHLFHMAKRVDADPEYYTINFSDEEEGITFHVKILNLRPADDGIFVCKIGELESTVEIVVIQPLQKVSLQLDELMPISMNQEEPLMVEPGEHKIKCTAEGSNPQPTGVSLFIAGNEIQAGDIQYVDMHADNRQYSASIETLVDIGYGDHHGKEIVCQGTGPDGSSMQVKQPVLVTTTPAKINCTNAKAYSGKRMVTINCTVNHQGVSVDDFKYKITRGSEEFIIPRGGSERVNGKIVKVLAEEKGGEMTVVNLIFSEVQPKDFDSKIHLVVESAGGYLDQGAQVRLVKIAGGDNDSSSMLTASLLTVALAYVLAKVL